jgi:hypothetical protein
MPQILERIVATGNMPPDLRRPGWTMCEPPASALGAPESTGGLRTMEVSRDDVDTVDVLPSGPPSVRSGVHWGGHVRSPSMSNPSTWSFVDRWKRWRTGGSPPIS